MGRNKDLWTDADAKQLTEAALLGQKHAQSKQQIEQLQRENLRLQSEVSRLKVLVARSSGGRMPN